MLQARESIMTEEFIELQALKKYENELIECLRDASIVDLVRQAAEHGIFPWYLTTIILPLYIPQCHAH